MPYMIPKGSVAVDGVSLTIASVRADTFSVALIPTTLAVTTLGDLQVGDRANIETDILVRTVIATLERWRAAGNPSLVSEEGIPHPALTVESLRENGWM
jgi:riboflavin synthase alpha subunit